MWPFSSREARARASGRPRRCPYRLRLEALEDRCLLSSGALDPTFGSGGIVTSGLSRNSLNANGMLLQPNGDIIVYGHDTNSGGSGAMARYTPSGSLDTTFGNKGFLVTPVNINRAALQSNGEIVTLGGAGPLARYNSNGSLDKTFGTNGVVQPNFTPNALVVQPNNDDILIGGNTSGSSSAYLARFTANGILDSTFGSGGEVVTSVPGKGTGVNSLALGNGDIVAGGQWDTLYSNGSDGAPYGWWVARYTLSGSLDTTFGSGGVVTSPSWPAPGNIGVPNAPVSDPYISSVLVQPNGQIVAVGPGTLSDGHNCWALVRYNTDGTLDSTFGSSGIVTTSITGDDFANAAALQSNGQIVVAGDSNAGEILTSSGSLFEVGVYNANGSLDTSFGSGGIVTLANYDANAEGVAIQPDGKIVAAGSEEVFGPNGKTTPPNFLLARFGPSAAQIGSFTASPNPAAAGSNVTLAASNITPADPSSTITQVAFYLDSNADGSLEPGTDQLLGYATQTSPGVWTFTWSTAGLTPGTYTLFAQATDSDGVLGDPDALSLTVQ